MQLTILTKKKKVIVSINEEKVFDKNLILIYDKLLGI